ncbi:MAG: hypothetical protein ACFFDI_07170 [Promethearchaeota archaeon]
MLAFLLNTPQSTYNPAGLIASFILLLVLLSIAIVVCSGLTVLFTYVAQSVVFGEKGIFGSFLFSWRFPKDYFLITLGALLLIHIFSYGLNVIFLTVLWWPFMESPPLIGLQIILVITQPFILTFQAISLSWVFDEFKHTIDKKESKTAQEYYQNH